MTNPDLSPSDDVTFDAVFPSAVRLISRRFWTPIAVARRAAELFESAGTRRVLDVGAGVGKFVLAAAAMATSIEFVGVEQRGHLVTIARQARAQLGVVNASFQVADATKIAWSAFDGFYLFNPLAENLFEEEDYIDHRVELTSARFSRDARRLEKALRDVPLGSSVVTYHGASARIPGCYELEAVEQAGTDWLRLWRKRRDDDDGSNFVEFDDGIISNRVGGAF